MNRTPGPLVKQSLTRIIAHLLSDWPPQGDCTHRTRSSPQRGSLRWAPPSGPADAPALKTLGHPGIDVAPGRHFFVIPPAVGIEGRIQAALHKCLGPLGERKMLRPAIEAAPKLHGPGRARPRRLSPRAKTPSRKLVFTSCQLSCMRRVLIPWVRRRCLSSKRSMVAWGSHWKGVWLLGTKKKRR